MSTGSNSVSAMPNNCKKLGAFLRISRRLCLVALVVVGAPTATLAGEKSFVRSHMEDKAKAKVMQLADQLVPIMLENIGLGFLSDFLADGSTAPEPIDYSKIGEIVSNELEKHDYGLSRQISNAALGQSLLKLDLLSAPTIRISEEMLRYGQSLEDTYNQLGEVRATLAPYAVEESYTIVAIDTLRMKIHSIMALDRRLGSPYNPRTLEMMAGELGRRYADGNFVFENRNTTLFEERIAKLMCVGDVVVDTMNQNEEYTQKNGNSCEGVLNKFRDKIRESYNNPYLPGRAEDVLAKMDLVLADCSEYQDRRSVVATRDGYENVVVGQDCTHAYLHIADYRFRDIEDGIWDVTGAAQAEAAEINRKLIKLGTDASERNEYVRKFSDVWYEIQDAARRAQRKLGGPRGGLIADFTISNNLQERAVDIRWHQTDGLAYWVGSVPPGGYINELSLSSGQFYPRVGDWFGIYSMDETDDGSIPASNDGRNDGQRMKLLCNFQIHQGADVNFTSLDPREECVRINGLMRDPITRKFDPDASKPNHDDGPFVMQWKLDPNAIKPNNGNGPFIMQYDANSGNQVYSLPMELEACLQTCQATFGCTTVRVSKKEDESSNLKECLLGLKAGPLDIYSDMDSYSADPSRKFDVLLN